MRVRGQNGEPPERDVAAIEVSRRRRLPPPVPPAELDLPAPPHDSLGRPLHDLRISVTDRCNFRCVYCMPREFFGRDHAFMPRAELLSFEELTRLGGGF